MTLCRAVGCVLGWLRYTASVPVGAAVMFVCLPVLWYFQITDPRRADRFRDAVVEFVVFRMAGHR